MYGGWWTSDCKQSAASSSSPGPSGTRIGTTGGFREKVGNKPPFSRGIILV